MLIWAVLLAATAAFDTHPGPFGHALSIALGTVDPFEAEGADVPAVALAVFSWLLVPAVVGIAVSLLMDNRIKAARPGSLDDLEARYPGIKSELK
jgi:hypothetical protein